MDYIKTLGNKFINYLYVIQMFNLLFNELFILYSKWNHCRYIKINIIGIKEKEDSKRISCN